MNFHRKERNEFKLAMINAEKLLIMACTTPQLTNAYKWYCIRKIALSIIKNVTIIILVFVSPMAAVEFIKNQFGGVI